MHHGLPGHREIRPPVRHIHYAAVRSVFQVLLAPSDQPRAESFGGQLACQRFAAAAGGACDQRSSHKGMCPPS